MEVQSTVKIMLKVKGAGAMGPAASRLFNVKIKYTANFTTFLNGDDYEVPSFYNEYLAYELTYV